MKAVCLLRVSSDGQTKRDGADEGYSIELQRQGCRDKAARLEADLVKEFIAPAQSASRGIYRELRKALDYVKNQGDIDYFIVYRLDRFARDELTQFTAIAELQAAGTKLVSVTEQIDESPQGMLTISLLGAVNAYRSRDDGRKISEGLTKKAELGGTPSRAKLGYLNVRHWDGANDIRTVKLDPERGPHLRWGFHAYSTGDLSISELSDLLFERGLRNRSNRKNQKSDKVGVPALHKILRDPYYIGVVTFRGVRYPGKHPKLVSPEVFDRVQTVLTMRRLAGERSRKHSHYLKGVVACGFCGRSLLFTKCKGKQGGQYDYFVCMGRHRDKNCDLPYLPVERVERFVTAYYESGIELRAERIAALRPLLIEKFNLLVGYRAEEAQRCEKEIAGLRAQRQQLVDSHLANPKAVPLDLLEVKQGELEGKIARAEVRLERAGADIDQAEEGLEAAQRLLANASGAYADMDQLSRRGLNQVFFKKLLVTPKGIEGAELTDEFGALLADDLAQKLEEMAQEKDEPHLGRGSNFDLVVEVPRSPRSTSARFSTFESEREARTLPRPMSRRYAGGLPSSTRIGRWSWRQPRSRRKVASPTPMPSASPPPSTSTPRSGPETPRSLNWRDGIPVRSSTCEHRTPKRDHWSCRRWAPP
jgi:DNA invertase Pin-like site-specific DNA recombinase